MFCELCLNKAIKNYFRTLEQLDEILPGKMRPTVSCYNCIYFSTNGSKIYMK